MHISNNFAAKRELALFDPSNIRALVNVVPEAFAKRIRDVWASDDGWLLGLTERGLKSEMIRRGKTPTAADNTVRTYFWLEYEHMMQLNITTKPTMDMSRVIRKSVAKESFYTHWLTDNCKLAWLVCPIVSYSDALEEAVNSSFAVLQMAVEKMRLQLEKDGLDLALVDKVVKIEAILFERMYGKNGRPIPKPKVPVDVEAQRAATSKVTDAETKEAERLARKARIDQMNKAIEEAVPKPAVVGTPT